MEFVQESEYRIEFDDYHKKTIGEFDREKSHYPEVIVEFLLFNNRGVAIDTICKAHIYENKSCKITDVNPKYVDQVEKAGYTEGVVYDIPSKHIDNYGDIYPILRLIKNDLRRGFGSGKRFTEEELFDIIIEHYGTTDKPQETAGATWLLTDGRFLQLGNVDPSEYTKWHYPYHFEVDKWLSDTIKINTDQFNMGIMSEVFGALRINRGLDGNEDVYIQLRKERPTQSQMGSLLDWMWVCYDEEMEDGIEVNTPGTSNYYYWGEDDPSKVLRAINRYYNTGELV